MAAYSVKKVRESLIEQLREKGADVTCFQELIDSYCYFYALERVMRADVKKNGLLIEVTTAAGGLAQKENPSIKNAASYNRQRLQILKELGLTTSSVKVIQQEESDL